MELSIEDEGPLGRKLRISIPAGDVDPHFEQRLRKMCGKIRLDGFRPGKVPLEIVRQRFGREVFNEVAADIMQEHYQEAINSKSLRPAGSPSFDGVKMAPGEGIEFTARIEIYPEFEMASMVGVAIERPVSDVTEEDLDDMVERTRKNHGQSKTVERPAAIGDRLTMDFSATVDGEPFPGGEGAGYPLMLGSNDLAPEFDHQLVGVCADEERTLTVRFPDDYPHARVAGREAIYEVRVSRVEEIILPEMDDAFFEAVGAKEGGLEQLRRYMREGAEERLHGSLKSLLKKNVMNALSEHNPIDLPAGLVQQEINQIRASLDGASVSGDGDDAGAPDQLLDDNLFREEAMKRVKQRILFMSFVQQHDLEADRESLEAKLNEVVDSYREPDVARNYYRNDRTAQAEIQLLVLEDMMLAEVLRVAEVRERQLPFKEALLMSAQR